MAKKINWPIAIIVALALCLWAVYTFGNYEGTLINRQNVPSTEVQKNTEGPVGQPEESKTPRIRRNDNITYAGWIPTWASVPGYHTVVKQKQLFHSISPVWYEVDRTGNLIDIRPKNATEIGKLARQNHIQIIPSIAMFDHEIFTEVLQNEANLTRHIETIWQTVLQNQYDGIDLDYESTKLSDKDKYFEFLERLSKKLRADNKTLVVTVLAKWGDDVRYSYLPQTRQVQDWSRIAKLADEIRIMTYDYTSASALNPGPIAPLDWMQQVIDYALTQAEPSKFVLGIHLYSYERWSEVLDRSQDLGFADPQLEFKQHYLQNTGVRNLPARSYDYSVVQYILQNFKGQLEDYQGEKIYRYSKMNETTGIYENRVLVYIDPQGVADRVELAKANGLRGVAFWQLGNGSELLQQLE